MDATLRGGLSDLVNTLNKLRNNTDDPDEADRIQKVLRVLFALWEEVIHQDINSQTAAYAKALSSLGEAKAAVQDALTDLKKTAKAINSAVKAAKAVDKIVKLIGPLFL